MMLSQVIARLTAIRDELGKDVSLLALDRDGHLNVDISIDYYPEEDRVEVRGLS